MRLAAGVLSLLVALAVVACGPGPKPATLLTLERLRKESTAAALKKAAPKLWQDSDNYYKLAYEAWEDSDDEESREYTLLGTIIYRTAETAAKRKTVEARILAFKGTLEKSSKLRDFWQKEKDRTEQAVSALQGQLSMANRLVALEKKRKKERLLLEGKLQLEQQLAGVQRRHADLVLRLKDSHKVEASKYAAGPYNKATNLLDKATLEIEDLKLREVKRTLEDAAIAIAAAYEEARPRFEKVSAAKAREEMNQRLVASAHEAGASEVRVEPRGVVLVVHNLFAKKSTTIQQDGTLVLDRVGKLMNDFPDYRVVIEGHTSDKGKDDVNLTLSQSWANSVLTHYANRGMPTSRFQTVGYGNGAPLSENTREGRKRNKRIEIVVLFPR